MIRQAINRALFIIALVVIAFMVVCSMAMKVMLDFNEEIGATPPQSTYMDYGSGHDPFVNNTTWYTDDLTDGYSR